MKPVFNEKKAIQVAASFIELSGGTLNYMMLIKLMYLADRKALLSWGRPITYDSYFSLPHGPVLSYTLDLISEGEQPDSASVWYQFISDPSNYSVSLRQECLLEDLSEAEEKVIKEIFREYGHFDKWELVKYLHKNLPEWKDPQGSSIPIYYRDILQADGRSEDEVKAIEAELEDVNCVSSILN